MKKITSILAAAMCIVLAVSCGQKKSAEAQEVAPEKTQAEIYAEQEIMVHLDSLASELVKINPIGIVGSVKDGKVVLSDKEKQVKPDYLTDPAVVKDMQTLSQKYRAIAVMCIDKEIAGLYDMPTDSYTAALVKLYADVNDPALKNFSEGVEIKENLKAFYEESKEADRLPLFWEAVSAALVEQMYIAGKNSDKFIVAFDDQSATDFTWYVTLLTLGVEDLAKINPEYAALNETLKPLTKIDAINVEMFKKQLDGMNEELAVSHDSLLR